MSQTLATVTVSRFLDFSGTLAVGTYKGGTAVKLGASANSVQNVTATTDKPAGILARDPDISLDGKFVDQVGLVVSGPAEGLAGGTVNIDDDVVITATGTLVAKSGAGFVVGKAITAAASGEYFQLLVNIRKEPA